MMKLTAEQISYIEQYLHRFQIKYYEVYVEILDHLILKTESILKNEPQISFEEAVAKAKLEFGSNGFKKISERTLTYFKDRTREMYGKEIKKFFSFPMIIMTIIGTIGFTVFFENFERPRYIAFLVVLLFLLMAIYQLKFWYEERKIENFKLIKNEFYFYGVHSVFMWSYFNGFIDFEETSIYARLYLSFTTTMSFVSLIIFIKMRKIINSEIKIYKIK